MSGLVFFAILVEKVDDIKALVLVVANKYLQGKPEYRCKHFVKAVQLPTVLHVEASQRLF